MGGTYRQKDKCIYNGMVYKKKKYIHFQAFLLSLSSEYFIRSWSWWSTQFMYLLYSFAEWSWVILNLGVHVAWSLELQLVGHWEYSRKHLAFYPATQMPLDFLFVSLVTGLSGDKDVPWFSTPSTFWIFSMNINAVVLKKKKSKKQKLF